MDEVYEGYIKSNEFDLNKTFPYFKEPIVYTASKYELLMDMFSYKYQYLRKNKKYILNLFGQLRLI